MSYFHVNITLEADSEGEWEFDLSEDTLRRRFVTPYDAGDSIQIGGKWIQPSDIDRLLIYESEADASTLGRQHSDRMRGSGFISVRSPSVDAIESYDRNVTSKWITRPPGKGRNAESGPESKSATSDATSVFVVHGRNSAVRDAMFSFLRAIGLKPIEWSEAVLATGRPTPYIGDILDAAFSQAQAVVVLLTPDDEAWLRPKFAQDDDPPHERDLSGQARPNVLFEAGMAMGRDSERTVLVEIGRLRPFSDIAGMHVVRFDGSTQRRQELAQRLEAAGCEVSRKGTDWHTTGDFGSE